MHEDCRYCSPINVKACFKEDMYDRIHIRQLVRRMVNAQSPTYVRKIHTQSYRRKIHTLQFAFRKKCDKKLLVHSPAGRITRSSKKLLYKLRKPNTEKYKGCLSYYGFKMWNQLPAQLQRTDDPNLFKYKIKTVFTSKQTQP